MKVVRKQQRKLPGNLAGLTVVAITFSTAVFLLVTLARLLRDIWLQLPD